jgi:hypothetical protein
LIELLGANVTNSAGEFRLKSDKLHLFSDQECLCRFQTLLCSAAWYRRAFSLRGFALGIDLS